MQQALLGCAIALVALMAGFHLVTRAPWGDETITLLTLAGHPEPNWSNGWREFYGSSSFRQIVLTLTYHDFHPPLYFWIAEAWRHFTGPSLTATRCLSALFVIASMGLAYRIALRWQMKYCALPALLFGLSGVSLVYAATARQYALAEFLILLTLYCGQRRSLWIALAAALAVATHYYALLAVLPILAVQLLTAWKSHKRWSLSVGLLFCFGVLALTPLLKVQLAARIVQYPQTSPLYREIAALAMGELAAGFPLSSKLWVAALSTLIATICLVFGVRKSVAAGNYVPLAGFLSFSLIFLAIEHSSHRPLPDGFPIPYYVGFCVPALTFLISYGVEQLPVLGFLLVPALLASSLTWTDRGFPHSNVKQIASEVHSHCDGCIVVAGASKARGMASALIYQIRDVPIFVLAKPGDAAAIGADASEASRIYFVPTADVLSQTGVESDFLRQFPHFRKLSSGVYLIEVQSRHR